jgi:hypothetical protein
MATAKNNKARGRTFQQEVRDAILSTFPQLEPDDVRSTGMGQPGEDIQMSPAARKLLPIQVECKRKKTFKTLYDWLAQAKTHGRNEPVVFTRADREEPLVICRMSHYLELQKTRGS